MNFADDSLSAQHVQLAQRLEQLAAAGRDGRWSEYRLHLGTLRDALQRHMSFEEEQVFPRLEASGVSAVRRLREEHAELRQHLEILGAAAPEQDPAGCIAELRQLAELLEEHHRAEAALDPRYATDPAPALGLDAPPLVDLRGLQPPEPIIRIFQALERSPGAPLRVLLPHEPVPLYGLLQERGYAWAGVPRADGSFELLIKHS